MCLRSVLFPIYPRKPSMPSGYLLIKRRIPAIILQQSDQPFTNSQERATYDSRKSIDSHKAETQISYRLNISARPSASIPVGKYIQCIKSNPIIEIFLWFRWLNMFFVLLDIRFPEQIPVYWLCSPGAQIPCLTSLARHTWIWPDQKLDEKSPTFIMRINSAAIEQDPTLRALIHLHIAMPQITMTQRRLDAPPARL